MAQSPWPLLEVGDGLNLLVGPNNCGKSNLLRALALALDKSGNDAFDSNVDVPAQMNWGVPTIDLWFDCDARVAVEDTLLKWAALYEKSVNARRPYADEGQVRFRVSYSGAGRQEMLMVSGAGNRRGDPQELERVLAQFHKCLRFIYLRSGESLSNFLVGAFRELLHTVLRDHLKEHVTRADERRNEYMNGLVEELLGPLQTHALGELQDIMAELTAVSIVPHVPQLNETLARADILIKDSAETALLNKGTGVRGALLVSLLTYLAANSRRSLILAVEEPESFLHPHAQRALRIDLTQLGRRDNVTLLVTTHSPFMLDRSESTRLTPFSKSPDGRTVIGEQKRGDAALTPIASSLFGETVTPTLLESLQAVDPSTRAVLFVEGFSDKYYMELAAEACGHPELLVGLEIRFDNGANKAALQALLLRQMMQDGITLAALFDWDEMGRGAKDLLVSKYQWQPRMAWTYRRWREDRNTAIPVEAEDMFAESLIVAFLETVGDRVLAEKMQYKDGSFHYGFTQEGKEWFMDYLRSNISASNAAKWIEILRAVRADLGIDSDKN